MKKQDLLIIEAKHRISNSCFNSHFHNAYELIYVTAGSISITVEKKTYIASKHSLILISNLKNHSATLLEAPFERYYSTISVPAADKMISSPTLISILKNQTANFAHVIDASAVHEDIMDYFNTVISESEEDTPFKNAMCACSLAKLLISLYRTYPESFPAVENNVSSIIYTIQKYIDENYEKPLLIEDIAKEHYIDLYHLSHSFKKLTGYSPKQYLTHTRLAHAKELLYHSQDPVGVISFKCGFSDTSNFIRLFKSEVGITPNQYRKQDIHKNPIF